MKQIYKLDEIQCAIIEHILQSPERYGLPDVLRNAPLFGDDGASYIARDNVIEYRGNRYGIDTDSITIDLGNDEEITLEDIDQQIQDLLALDKEFSRESEELNDPSVENTIKRIIKAIF